MRTRLTLASSLAALALGATAALSAPAAPAYDRSGLDTTCAPCRDFNQFANGGWLAHAEIPAAYATWGSFVELGERNRETLHRILETARANAKATRGSAPWMLGTFYASCMDSDGVEAAGLGPVRPQLTAVDGMKGVADMPRVLAALHGAGIPGVFGFRAGQDPKNSDLMIAFAGQGGIGLPDRDYYFRSDSASKATRAAYLTGVTKLLKLAGADEPAAKADADRVFALETALAGASMNAVERRDPKATYHKMPVDSLIRLAPIFGWRAYLTGRGVGALDSVNVTQPRFFRGVDSLLAAVPLDTWKAYFRVRVLTDAAPFLSRAFAETWFEYQKVLSGTEVMQPRWKRSLTWTDQDLGDLLGQAYVKERFPAEARERAMRMVKNLEAALGDRIAGVDWMTDATRAAARAKLEAFANKIGYPDTWRDYAGVELARATLYANHLSAQGYELRRNLSKLGKPVDRGEWNMTPPTVNAFYSSSLNSINFPAGILQPPFFDPSWDDALNYGGIGAVIGHEMTHGFDDRGRQFDAKGNLRDWWTAEDAANYKSRADQVADQFSSYTVLDTLHLNGRLTLGENIADLGGLAVAYHALQKALEGKQRTTIDGFTPEQRFFLSYARVWRGLYRPEALRTRVQTDPHSPPVWRVNGPLSNLPEFAQAFGCKAGDPMVRDEGKRARIW
jgi:putative endopeptidase